MAHRQQPPPDMGQPTQGYLGHLTFDPLLVPALHPRCSSAFAECVTWLFAHEVLHAEDLVHAWYPSELAGAILELHQRVEGSWYERGGGPRAVAQRRLGVRTLLCKHDVLPQSDPRAWQQAKRRRFEVAPSGREDED